MDVEVTVTAVKVLSVAGATTITSEELNVMVCATREVSTMGGYNWS